MGKLFRKQFIPAPIEECWEFFSKPENLAHITPDDMGFTIVDFDDKPMYEGQEIRYVVSPFSFIHLRWTTRIINVKHQREFVDIQLKGPYKRWHHRHIFKSVEGGVEMIDAIHYKIPFGLPGKFLMKSIIKKKLDEIFEFRQKQIDRFFPNK